MLGTVSSPGSSAYKWFCSLALRSRGSVYSVRGGLTSIPLGNSFSNEGAFVPTLTTDGFAAPLDLLCLGSITSYAFYLEL